MNTLYYEQKRLVVFVAHNKVTVTYLTVMFTRLDKVANARRETTSTQRDREPFPGG